MDAVTGGSPATRRGIRASVVGLFPSDRLVVASRPAATEVILENEVMLSADGTVSVEIDTLPAKELMERWITATPSRRKSSTSPAEPSRGPARFWWRGNRSRSLRGGPGYFRTGDVVEAGFQVQTLDEKPVAGKGKLALLKIAYDKEGEPIETEVGAWDVDPNDRGEASHKFNAAEPGSIGCRTA